ncbi:PTS sugar transporter subunit IIA, partial [Salmonella enterica subsp. enterica serovar Kentucky]|nr:PTS sugar transporter subunit IIA [Salmonella enterica subsp. enterica serovar Kentucky]
GQSKNVVMVRAMRAMGVDYAAEYLQRFGFPAQNIVHTESLALVEREASFPTGIALERHAVAIPHCEAVHAKSPAIYLIRPDK